ncbi:Ig-like domain-containing protein [Microvirga brassicacearum]|uniref:Uncharacterized protein n=1 Tax=Microvirga brassicacearum TaxID=2580413 RepID=A0A5N3P5C1_9HYPH|nr:Ig-like domain-containing protein [Microvirga brassicacearum]KAB0264938.1 hypothetical protein FEZ63_20840 [Microvirga brassicacearum]
MKPTLAILALPAALLFSGPALAQSMCVVAGNQPIMGANMTADFDVAAGQGCTYDIRPRGTLTSAEVSQPPQNGTIKMVDKDTLTYEPKAGFRGADSFVITAKGQSVDEKPGTSVLSFKVNVK